MRKPRVEDFDTTAEPPKLGSPIDNVPAIERAPARPAGPASSHPPRQPGVPDREPRAPLEPYSPYAPPVRPVRRRMRRWAYELYEDQIDRLRWLAAQELLRGERGSASEMVRQAIDEWLARQGDGQS